MCNLRRKTNPEDQGRSAQIEGGLCKKRKKKRKERKTKEEVILLLRRHLNGSKVGASTVDYGKIFHLADSARKSRQLMATFCTSWKPVLRKSVLYQRNCSYLFELYGMLLVTHREWFSYILTAKLVL